MSLKTNLHYRLSSRAIKVKDNKDIVVMSFNIRCINQNDIGNMHYKVRMPLIKKVLEEENPDIIGFQEVKVKQHEYLLKILKKYDYVYQKRDDKPGGEANPIFFKKNRFACSVKKTFWLSNTPEIMSNTFGGKCTRVCCYVCLKDKTTNKEFYVYNTHLDHIGVEARIKGIKLIKRIINESKLTDTPHLIMGDMNDTYKSETINELLKDYTDASSFNHQESKSTFHDYGKKAEKIDFIVLNKGIKLLDYKVISKTFNNIYPSDHYPIEAVINV